MPPANSFTGVILGSFVSSGGRVEYTMTLKYKEEFFLLCTCLSRFQQGIKTELLLRAKLKFKINAATSAERTMKSSYLGKKIYHSRAQKQ